MTDSSINASFLGLHFFGKPGTFPRVSKIKVGKFWDIWKIWFLIRILVFLFITGIWNFWPFLKHCRKFPKKIRSLISTYRSFFGLISSKNFTILFRVAETKDGKFWTILEICFWTRIFWEPVAVPDLDIFFPDRRIILVPTHFFFHNFSRSSFSVALNSSFKKNVTTSPGFSIFAPVLLRYHQHEIFFTNFTRFWEKAHFSNTLEFEFFYLSTSIFKNSQKKKNYQENFIC